MECISLLATANLQALNAIGRADVVLKLEFYKKPLMLVILIFTAFISPLAICVGMLVYSFYSFVVNAFPNRKLLSYPIMEQLKDVGSNSILALSMGGVVYFMGIILQFNDLIVLLLQIMFGIAYYIIISMLTKNESYIFVRDMILNQIKNKSHIVVQS